MASQKVFHISRPLLNKDFKKYQLVPNKLESASVKLSPTELVKKGERKEFSKNYYHLWFFKLNNYFIVDPWNPSIVYWFSKANEVIRGTIAVSYLLLLKCTMCITHYLYSLLIAYLIVYIRLDCYRKMERLLLKVSTSPKTPGIGHGRTWLAYSQSSIF